MQNITPWSIDSLIEPNVGVNRLENLGDGHAIKKFKVGPLVGLTLFPRGNSRKIWKCELCNNENTSNENSSQNCQLEICRLLALGRHERLKQVFSGDDVRCKFLSCMRCGLGVARFFESRLQYKVQYHTLCSIIVAIKFLFLAVTLKFVACRRWD